MTLAQVRADIDAIDGQMVKLLAARQVLVRQAATFKSDEQAVRAPDRRVAMMRALHERALVEGVEPKVVEAVYDAMIDAFIDLELHEHTRISGPETPPR